MKLDTLFEAGMESLAGPVKKKKTAKAGGKDGTPQGDTQYHELEVNDEFTIEREPEQNVTTDDPYQTHIESKSKSKKKK